MGTQTQTYYRIQSAELDPADLLDEANWSSRVWVGEVYRPCDAPGCSEGLVDGTMLDEYGDPVAEICERCQGTGEVDDSTRRGVSCCESLADLHRYFRRREAELGDCVVVTLTGAPADDEDWDAAEGAVLVIPTAIISVEPLIVEEV